MTVSAPPRPPQRSRRLVMRPLQWLGLVVMLLAPLLALVGVFGPATETATAEGDGIRLVVVYPSLVRYLTINEVRVRVTNLSGQTASLRLEVDPPYLESFAELAMAPGADEFTASVWVFTWQAVPAGETRQVLISGRAAKPFVHTGWLRASAAGHAPASLSITTLVFP